MILNKKPDLGTHGYTDIADVLEVYKMTKQEAIKRQLTHGSAISCLNKFFAEIKLERLGWHQTFKVDGRKVKKGMKFLY